MYTEPVALRLMLHGNGQGCHLSWPAQVSPVPRSSWSMLYEVRPADCAAFGYTSMMIPRMMSIEHIHGTSVGGLTWQTPRVTTTINSNLFHACWGKCSLAGAKPGTTYRLRPTIVVMVMLRSMVDTMVDDYGRRYCEYIG